MPSYWIMQDKSQFLVKANISFGMIHTCSSIAQTRSLEDVCLVMIFIVLFSFVMIKLAEGTLVLRRLQKKFCSIGFTGLSFFMTVINFVKLPIDARGEEVFQKETLCLSIRF